MKSKKKSTLIFGVDVYKGKLDEQALDYKEMIKRDVKMRGNYSLGNLDSIHVFFKIILMS